MRDLTGEAPDVIAAQRTRVATGGGEPNFSPSIPAGKWGGSPPRQASVDAAFRRHAAADVSRDSVFFLHFLRNSEALAQ
jgi:hypothetical protein